MNELNGMAPDLSPEDQERARASIERMRQRHREHNYRTNPPIPAKLHNSASGISVLKPASGPPVPIPGLEPDDESDDDGG